MSNKPGWVGDRKPNQEGGDRGGGGRIGTQAQSIQTKDKMGFDLEVLNRVDRRKNLSEHSIRVARKRDQRVRDELSGEPDKKAKAEITLPKFSWDK